MEKIINEINSLKKEKNAIILAHYYAPGEVQALADYVGDSYYLAKVAKNTDADIVVFCGVGFMGESVKLLNPEKKVLMPDMSADCPMAHMAEIEKIEEMRKQYEDLAVVCYINSTAELKCHSDVCVTSSNAIKIVKALPNKNIFFIPDENLGRFVAKQVPEKNIILNKGYCPVHAVVTAEQVAQQKAKHPNALVLTHPECREEVLALSDVIGSTAEIIAYAKNSDKTEFIICTEEGVAYPLELNDPNKKFYFARESFSCVDMKLNPPEKVLHVLKTEENQVEVDEAKRVRAMLPLDRMLEMAK
ncbi:MAG: quinolinate synthase NadA [Oscillospiraceae bacterium]|nr:quinolinate synthase NadA [Oscillospiraceae bacterium]